MVPTNMYDSICVPDLGSYLEYGTGTILPGEDRKPLTVTPTPAHTPTPASTNNNFLHEGKSKRFYTTRYYYQSDLLAKHKH